MAHKASLAKDHFPARNNMLVAMKISIAQHPLQALGGRHEIIGEHNFEHLVGANWEGIIGDRLLSR